MPTKAELQSLLERVEKATGADRELDAEIHIALVPDYGARYEFNPARFVLFRDVWAKNRADHLNHANNVADWWKCPTYTASIDCDLALVERVLPGHTAGWQPGIGNRAWATIYRVTEIEVGTVEKANHVTLPLAILSALLRALIAQADEVEA